MVETSLEIECCNCQNKYWYSGDKNYPENVECPNCNKQNQIPENA